MLDQLGDFRSRPRRPAAVDGKVRRLAPQRLHHRVRQALRARVGVVEPPVRIHPAEPTCSPHIALQELDADEVTFEVRATPVDPGEGGKLAREVLDAVSAFTTQDTAAA
jgi:hypothetical protein